MSFWIKYLNARFVDCRISRFDALKGLEHDFKRRHGDDIKSIVADALQGFFGRFVFALTRPVVIADDLEAGHAGHAGQLHLREIISLAVRAKSCSHCCNSTLQDRVFAKRGRYSAFGSGLKIRG